MKTPQLVDREAATESARQIGYLLAGIDRAAQDGIEKAIQQFQEDKFRIMVLGKAKRGKSTLINAWLGRSDDLVAPIDNYHSLVLPETIEILQKLDDHLYEARRIVSYWGYPPGYNPPAPNSFILKTTDSDFSSNGRARLPMVFVEKTTVELKNGFEREVNLYEEVDQGDPEQVRMRIDEAVPIFAANVQGHPPDAATLDDYIRAMDEMKAKERSADRMHPVLAYFTGAKGALIFSALLKARLKYEPQADDTGK